MSFLDKYVYEHNSRGERIPLLPDQEDIAASRIEKASHIEAKTAVARAKREAAEEEAKKNAHPGAQLDPAKVRAAEERGGLFRNTGPTLQERAAAAPKEGTQVREPGFFGKLRQRAFGFRYGTRKAAQGAVRQAKAAPQGIRKAAKGIGAAGKVIGEARRGVAALRRDVGREITAAKRSASGRSGTRRRVSARAREAAERGRGAARRVKLGVRRMGPRKLKRGMKLRRR